MNKKIIFIAILTLVALGGLVFYTYGPASHPVGPMVNPASLKPSPVTSSASSTSATVSAYHNRDLAENFYTIQFPQSWTPQANQAGSYSFTFGSGTAKVETMDVPDNSTLELFVLSQDEPKLKSSITVYARTGYQKLTVNGNAAYQLVYTSSQNGVSYQTTRTYITGADKAGLITLTVRVDQSSSVAPTFAAILQSFKWEK